MLDRKDVREVTDKNDRYRQTRIPLAYYNLWWSGVMILCPCSCPKYQGDMDDGCLGEEGMTGIQTRVMM